MEPEYLSTGQAAKLLSVTPDTVLKWIKKGKLEGIRTPGGHYRVSRKNAYALQSEGSGESVKYCWEHKSEAGELPEGCENCLVYLSRAQRCYELAQATKEDFSALTFCQGDCGNCEYHDLVKGQAATVLVVTPDELARRSLAESATRAPFNVAAADSAYGLSALVDKSPPDFVVLDADLGPDEVGVIARHVKEDPRIRVTRIVLATEGGELPEECEEGIFAHMEKPLTVENIERAFRELKLATW